MIVYQPAVLHTGWSDLKHLAFELAKTLISAEKPIVLKADAESVQLGACSVLTSAILALYAREIGQDDWEGLTRDFREIRLRRKQEHGRTLSFYLLAPKFSEGLVRQIESKEPHLYLYEWYFVHSRTDEAILIRELKESAHSFRAEQGLKNRNQESFATPYYFLKPKLSPSESAAFARLNAELRHSRLPHSSRAV